MKAKDFVTTGIVLAQVVIFTKAALAVEGPGPGEGMGFWTILFLCFGALIILFQAVPAFLMLGSMLTGLFKKPVLKDAKEADRAR